MVRSPELGGFSFTPVMFSRGPKQCNRTEVQEGHKGYAELSAEMWPSTCAALVRISCSAVFIGRYGLKSPPQHIGQHENGTYVSSAKYN
jgi:hypothetical protein